MIYTCYKKLDELGRIVLPKDIREKIAVTPGEMLKLDVEGDRIVITKAEKNCIFCGKTGDLRTLEGKIVCKNCIKKLNQA